MPPTAEVLHLQRLAQRDWDAYRVLADATHVSFALACFHAQQCVEKLLKAAIVSRGRVFQRTHNLLILADLAEQAGLDLPVPRSLLDKLTPYAFLLRYEDVQVEELLGTRSMRS